MEIEIHLEKIRLQKPCFPEEEKSEEKAFYALIRKDDRIYEADWSGCFLDIVYDCRIINGLQAEEIVREHLATACGC